MPKIKLLDISTQLLYDIIMRKANNKLYKLFQTEDAARVALIEMNKEHNLAQISIKLGVGKDTVTHWFQQLDIPVNQNTFKSSLTGRKLKKAPDQTITKEYLSDLYFTKHKTQQEIAQLTGLAKWTVQNLFKEYDIKPRQARNKNVSSDTEQKLNDKDWLTEQHHKENKSIAQISEELNVSGTTLLKRFDRFQIQKLQAPGNSFKNIFKDDEEAKEKLQEFNKTMSLTEIANTYNLDVGTVSLWFKKYNIIPKIHYTSKEQKEIFEFISNHTQCEFNHRGLLGRLEIDIYLPEFKIGIELDGIYWHSVNKILDINYHKNKTNRAEEAGIFLYHFYDTEWKSKTEIVKSMILCAINKCDRIYARETALAEVDHETAKKFYNDNHIQGNIFSKINYGLYYNSELVSMMSFSKNRYSDQVEWELTRFCNKLNTRVLGAAGKLLSHFVKIFDPNSIISYADRRYSKGKMYEKIGFSLKNTTIPGYHYNINGKLESRQRWQKHMLPSKLKVFDPLLTEEQNMTSNGYHRVYNCGQMVYIWNKPI